MNVQIPLNWPAPKFSLGQPVKARDYTGQIIGLEFQDEDHYLVRREGSEIGWAYTIQVDPWCSGGQYEPILIVDESEIALLPTALVLAA